MPSPELGADMRRRQFIAGIGGTAAWPLLAHAQQAMPVIGFLNVSTPEAFAVYVTAFKQGLRQVGYVEGQNLSIEYRWARGIYDRLPALATELVSHHVTVIAANGGSRVALAAKASTSTIPIVFTFGDGDPVRHGLVESINQPGRNVTGVILLGGALESKRLELLREIAPKATNVYILVNPDNAGVLQDIPTVAASAGQVGIGFQVLQAGNEREIDTAFSTLAKEQAQALMVANDAILQTHAAQITALAVRYKISVIYPWREYAVAGGLISYGTSIREAYRQSGLYVGQILKGSNPAELPVQQPTKFELVVNLKTAKAIGIEMPTSVLLRADEVIE